MSGDIGTSRYQSTGSRDPIWTRVSGDPHQPNVTNQRHGLKESVGLESSGSVTFTTPIGKSKGLNVVSTAIFIAGEMAGSGILALPRAVVDSGWIGLILVVVFCINAGFGGTRLGACWAMLEERYPEHRTPVRNPYAMIAYRAYGKWVSKLVSGCIQLTLFGAGTVYLLIASQIVQDLLQDILPAISDCVWFLIICLLLCPSMWLGSPKDFMVVAIGALLTTAVACVLIFTQIVMDGMTSTEPIRHSAHGFDSFFMSFGTILFAFGGASTFPTIQNDMVEKHKFSQSVIIGFSVIMMLYLPVAVGGYFVFGDEVDVNVVLSLSRTSLVMVANILMAIHLVLAFLIVINPVCQELEELLKVPRHIIANSDSEDKVAYFISVIISFSFAHHHAPQNCAAMTLVTDFHWKRCTLRSSMMLAMLFIGESVPQFGKILALVGGSAVTLLTFVFPSLFYMRLCDQKHVDWPQRSIPTYIRVYLWELILIGLVGGAASAYTAISAIFSSATMTVPCYLR